jgi:hypothetical protein
VKLLVSRTGERQYETTAVRADGVTIAIGGHGFAHRLPRHLAHFAVEDALQLRHGFWGSLAAGALVSGARIADGQPTPSGTAEKSAAVIEATAPFVSEARSLVGAFDDIVEQRLESRWPQVDPALQTLTIRRGARLVSLTKTDVARVTAAWRELQARWEKVPVGGTLELDWQAPLMSGNWPALKG